ncbi:PLP-dependent aminotransferase family protein [Opitutaceae bacterium EW11]|nr:PLP-dependent aminotransferase family protein [Opitutaceae bacterium EW11]
MSATTTPVLFSDLGRRAAPPTIARLMTVAIETPELLSLAAGFTDNRTLPAGEVADVARSLAAGSSDPEYLQYGTNQGRQGLRRVLGERLRSTEPAYSAEQLAERMIVTNGSQQALYLAAQVLCNPGDIVLVDRPSYFVFLEVLLGLGIQARSLPTHADGSLDATKLGEMLDAMKARGEADRIRAVYFVSYFSNPSARSLSAQEKAGIADALQRRGLTVPVIEDAAYRDLYFQAPHNAPSVLSMEEWGPFPKLYLSTLTKPFATGLKVGYGVCTHPELLKKLLHVKGHHDFGSANFNQAVLEKVIADGGFERQLKRIRPMYAAKMEALHASLEAAGLERAGWRWNRPDGGLYLWLEAPSDVDTRLDSRFCKECLEAGVVYVPGDLCFGDEAPTHFVRLSFGVLEPNDLAEAGRRFGSVAARFR